jgi:hypothetical protein
MARSEGSLCSTESKVLAEELQTLTGLPYKQNLDYIRFMEKLLMYRVTEQVCENTNEYGDKPVTKIEIPLLGTLTIKPVLFHKTHRLTEKPSLHFEYEFQPLSGFKKHLCDAYISHECSLPTEFAEMYGQKLNTIFKEGE